MAKTKLLAVALVLSLVPFALITYGVRAGVETLWWAGLALLVVGGLVPPIVRYAFDEEDDGDEADDEGGGEDGG